MKESKSGARYVLWIVAALGTALLGMKLFLYASILRNDGTTALAAQIKSDGLDTLWLLMWVSILSVAIILLTKLIRYGLHAVRHHTPPHVVGDSRR